MFSGFRFRFKAQGSGFRVFCITRFPSSPLIIRVPFFLLFGFKKATQKEKV